MSAALAPFGGPGVMVVKSTRLAQQLNNLLKEESPARLRQINEEKLADMGVANDLAEKFLNHPAFTPRQSIRLLSGPWRALNHAHGKDAFIQYALAANDEETANFFKDMVENHEGIPGNRDLR